MKTQPKKEAKKIAKIGAFIVSIAVMASLVLAPGFILAKENGNGNNNGNNEKKEQKKQEKQESKQEKKETKQAKKDQKKNTEKNAKNENGGVKCLKAFGHLIAPGWIKHNGPLTIGENCRLPFGIWKKLNGGNGTTTPPLGDITAPIISSLVANPRVGSAVVRWTTNERADSTVFYSTTSPVNLNSSSTKSVTRLAFARDHRLVLNSLTSSTTYFAIVRSKDPSGNTATSSQISFVTKPSNAVNDILPPVISVIVGTAGTSTVQVGWKTNEFAASRVYYSTLSSVDLNATTTSFVENTSLVKNHSLKVSGLASSTVYYFIVESADASGNVSRSGIFSRTTSASPVVIDTTDPILHSVIATVGSTTANLSWTTDENATTKAYFGTSTPLNISASSTSFVENTSLVTNHALAVSGLATSTMYYMILESKDSSGNAGHTNQFSFTTASGL